jgi:hypothetical protein
LLTATEEALAQAEARRAADGDGSTAAATGLVS